MKSKVVHICCFFIFLIYIFFCAGVSFGKSAAGVKDENVAAEVAIDAPGPIENIQFTYEYETFEAEGHCLGCTKCKRAKQIKGQYIEISGVGFLPVEKESNGRLRIYFNNCESAEDFGVQSVSVMYEQLMKLED